MKNKIILFCFLSSFVLFTYAQDIPQHVSYTRIYSFLNELANDGYIEVNSAVKPYSRKFISEKLLEAQSQSEKLNRRQREEIKFFLNEYALEQNKLPEAWLETGWQVGKNGNTELSLMQPGVFYKDDNFKARITPLLGMHISSNSKGSITKRWFGVELQGTIGKNLTIWGSLRDISMTKVDGDMLSGPTYLNDQPGYQYKEASYGGDYSDSRGGIKYGWNWGSFGLAKDNVIWGDNNHGSNIFSGRAPSFPMLTLNLKPARWFELNYFHGWLVSNVLDSTYYYIENGENKHYRQANKFVAANMMTFTPIRNLNLSIGNAIVYGERNIQAAYFIPIAFYKSLDHTLTKGIRSENQNSQMFFNISSRNIKHLHLYTSVFIDDFSISRLKPSNEQANPISYKIGANLSNFPVQNLSFIGEITKTNIINYKHSIPTLTWTSNSYNLGHYLGDNSQEIHFALKYRPIRGLDFDFSITNARHGKEYNYIRRGIDENGNSGNILSVITYPSLGEIIWKNQTVGLKTVYEVFNNAYAIVNIEYNNAQGFENDDAALFAETKMTAQEALDYYTPKFFQGKNTSITIGFSFGF